MTRLYKLPKIDPNQESITIDLETCDPELKVTAPGFISGVGFVAGIAIAADEGSWYIPIQHAEGSNYDKKTVIKWLNKVLSCDTNEKVMHNAQYDLGWLKSMGVRVRGALFDTMLAAPLLDENSFSFTLDGLGKRYCNEGKFEEALKLAVKDKYKGVKTHKSIIRLKDEFYDYEPFKETKTRVCPYYDLWPEEVKSHYEVLGNATDEKGTELFKVPVTRSEAIKGLMWAIDPEEMGSYPIQDVDLTRKLYKVFKPMLEEQGLTKLAHLENEVCPILLEMREKGVRINMKQAIVLDKKYTKELNKLQKQVDTLVGSHLNVNADTELVALCEKLGLEYAKTEKDNASFTAENVPKDEQGIFQIVLAIRKLNKARDTYIRGYIFGMTLGGWLHGQYNQLKSDENGTVTGRLSSSNPNMQNLPAPRGEYGKEIRALFLPDTDEELWLCMDYSGQEPKMMVHTVLNIEAAYGQIQIRNATNAGRPIPDTLIRILPGSDLAATEEFRGRTADFHNSTASACIKQEWKMIGKPVDITSEEFISAFKAFRPKAKSIGLGTMYGSGDQKVADEMTRKGSPMTKDEAHNVRVSIYENVPFLKSLNDLLMNKAKTRGYILTILGRRGRFDKWEVPVFDKKERKAIGNTLFSTQEEANTFYRENRKKYEHLGRPQRAFIYRALNKLIQGSSADQTKMAMYCLYNRNDSTKRSLDIYYRAIPDFEPPKMKIQVHDEINCSIRKDEGAQWYQDTMENCIKLRVEVVAEPHVCNNWAEAK